MDSVKLYFASVKRLPALNTEDARKLFFPAQRGDMKAKRRLIEGNLRLVISIAKKYYRNDISFSDLIEEGNLGLIRAIEKFNPNKGYYFSTYASFWINQYIKRYIDAHSRTVRIPEHMLEKMRKWLREFQKLKHRKGRNPTAVEMARKLDMPQAEVSRLLSNLELARAGASLDAPFGEEDESQALKDVIAGSGKESPELIINALKLNDQLEKALKILKPKEARALGLRYGLGKNRQNTLEEAGRKMHLSRERVRQLEEKAFDRIRKLLMRADYISG